MDNRHKKYKVNQDVVSATMVILITAIGAQKTEKLLYSHSFVSFLRDPFSKTVCS